MFKGFWFDDAPPLRELSWLIGGILIKMSKNSLGDQGTVATDEKDADFPFHH